MKKLLKVTVKNRDENFSYMQVGHGSDQQFRVWLWDGRRIDAKGAERTHEQIWGLQAENRFKGRWDGAKLTIITPNEMPKFVPMWLLDALEREFGTPAEVLVF